MLTGKSPKSKAPDPCPHQEIIDLYHEVLPMCPRVRIWNDKQQALLRSRWKEDPTRQSPEWWRKFFRFVAKSAFLTGGVDNRRDAPFVADLEWLVRPSNMAKIANGKYHRLTAEQRLMLDIQQMEENDGQETADGLPLSDLPRI